MTYYVISLNTNQKLFLHAIFFTFLTEKVKKPYEVLRGFHSFRAMPAVILRERTPEEQQKNHRRTTEGHQRTPEPQSPKT